VSFFKWQVPSLYIMRFPNWSIPSIFVNSSCRRHGLSIPKQIRYAKWNLRREHNSYWYTQKYSSLFYCMKCNSNSLCRIYGPDSLVMFVPMNFWPKAIVLLWKKHSPPLYGNIHGTGRLSLSNTNSFPPLKCWIPGGRKGMTHFMLQTVTNFIWQIQAHWQSAAYFN
jgi:hypothetical protein